MLADLAFAILILPHVAFSLIGKATFYGAGTTGGNCGLPNAAPFPDRMVVAIGPTRYLNSAGCGQCYEVTCTGGSNGQTNCCKAGQSVIVQSWDQCPECSNTHLDLSEQAFAKIGNPTCGIIAINFQPVDCPISSNIIIKNKDGVNAWWFAIFLFDVGGKGDVSTVEIKESGSNTWVTASRQQYNAYLITSASGLNVPLSVRLTNAAGVTITATDVVTNTNGNSQFNFGKNFPGSGGGGGGGSNPAPLPTSKPVTAPVALPTTPPPVPPITPASFQIKIKNGANRWWLAVFVEDRSGTRQGITSIDARGNGQSKWIPGVASQWGFWVMQNNAGYILPVSIKFILNGQSYVACAAVTQIADNRVYTSVAKGNYCPITAASVSGASGSSSGSSGGGSGASSNSAGSGGSGSTPSGAQLGAIVGGSAAAFVCLVLAIGGCLWYRKKQATVVKEEPLLGGYQAPQRTVS